MTTSLYYTKLNNVERGVKQQISLPLPLIQEGQLSVIGEIFMHKVLVNCLEDKA